MRTIHYYDDDGILKWVTTYMIAGMHFKENITDITYYPETNMTVIRYNNGDEAATEGQINPALYV